MRKLTNWYEAYQEYTEDFEPPKIFHKWSAIAGLSSLTGRKVWVQEGNRKLYPNLYVILVGPPGCGKGQSMRELRPFLQAAGVRISPDKLTAAKMIKAISESQVAHPTLGLITPYMIWAEELPSFLGGDAYESGMISDLTALYDSPDEFRKETKTRGDDLIPNAYLVVFAATTSQGITDSLPSGTIGQGFTSRLMFVYSDYPERRVEEKPWAPKHALLKTALEIDAQRIAELHGPMDLSDVAKVLWSDYYHARPMPGDEFGDARLQGYSSRKPMYVRKLAALLSVAEGDSLIIEAQHIEGAIQLLKEIDFSVLQVYNEITPSIIVSHYPRVLRVLQKAVKGVMSHSNLMRKFASTLDAAQFKMVMDGLEQMKHIERCPVLDKLTNRHTMYYQLVQKKGGRK